MNVLILNGGRSLRMGGESKCLAVVNGKTIFQHEIEFLNKNLGQYDLLVSTGNNEEIANYCKTNHVEYFTEDVPLGDGGAIKMAMKKIREKEASISFLLVMNGDIITKINLEKLVSQGKERLIENTELYGIIVVIPYRSHLGVMECTNNTGFSPIKSFKEKPIFPQFYSSCGMYLLNTNAIDIIQDAGGFANEVISNYYDKFECWIVSSEEWVAVETKKDLLTAEFLVNNHFTN